MKLLNPAPIPPQPSKEEILVDVQQILEQTDISFEDKVQRAVHIGSEGSMGYPLVSDPVVGTINTFVFNQLVAGPENGGVHVSQAEKLRAEIYPNKPVYPDPLSASERIKPADGVNEYREHLLGKRALRSALSAYSAYAGGPRHTLFQTFGIKKLYNTRQTVVE